MIIFRDFFRHGTGRTEDGTYRPTEVATDKAIT